MGEFKCKSCVSEIELQVELLEGYIRIGIEEKHKEEYCGMFISYENAARLRKFLKPEKKAKKSRWIPVSERLPADNVKVLFYDAFCDDVLYGIHAKVVPQWHSDDGIYFHGREYSNITHWMPKPEPPEEK